MRTDEGTQLWPWITNTENIPLSRWGRTLSPGEVAVGLTQLFQDKVLIVLAANISGEGLQLIWYFSAIPLPLSFFPLYPSPLLPPFCPQFFCWIMNCICRLLAFFCMFCYCSLCSKHPVAIRTTLLFRVNFGLWKAEVPLFSTANQDFYCYVNISKIMELLERKKSQYVIFLHFVTEAVSQHFLSWLLSFQTSLQVGGNCLSSSEPEARDWHLLKWNTPHSLHFLEKPQAFPSS